MTKRTILNNLQYGLKWKNFQAKTKYKKNTLHAEKLIRLFVALGIYLDI